MIQEFSEGLQEDAHRQFQQWCQTHAAGFFLNRTNRNDFLLHTALCRHVGNTDSDTKSGHSLARKSQICSMSVTKLQAWASYRSSTVQPCHDCEPLRAAGNYIAYHSSELMGREYHPKEDFYIFSRKTKSFLQRAVGSRAWVVVSTGKRPSLRYRLVGMFTPSEIRANEDGFHVIGHGIPFHPAFEVTALPWFIELLREQNKFSFGFNRIRDSKLVDELERLLEQHGGNSVLQPDEVATPSQYFEGATRQVFTNRYERNSYARQQCILHHGYRCSACDFDFEAVYGDLGGEFIHVHHLKPLSEIGQEYVIDPVADLRPICPNCHAMIHRSTKMMAIEDLRKLIHKNASRATVKKPRDNSPLR